MTMDALGAHPTTEPAPVADSVLFFIRLGNEGRGWNKDEEYANENSPHLSMSN